ncbi:MAG TPA: hypothetical protein VLF43_02685 [Candidatus Saccharimonadales bacterium]|nr:hypothetical protein [Candidatus Saccharimonadales bacterium]
MEQQAKKTFKNKLGAFSERRPVRAVLGLLALGLAYVFASLAINSGSLLDYAITLLLIVIGVRESFAAIRGGRRKGRG